MAWHYRVPESCYGCPFLWMDLYTDVEDWGDVWVYRCEFPQSEAMPCEPDLFTGVDDDCPLRPPRAEHCRHIVLEDLDCVPYFCDVEGRVECTMLQGGRCREFEDDRGTRTDR